MSLPAVSHPSAAGAGPAAFRLSNSIFLWRRGTKGVNSPVGSAKTALKVL